jgi:hypothetical protein
MANQSGFEFMQIAATLAAGLLSNNPHNVKVMQPADQAEFASDLYNCCLKELRERPLREKPKATRRGGSRPAAAAIVRTVR